MANKLNEVIDKQKVEAILFAVGKEISTERVASLCSLDSKLTEKLIKKLQEDYSANGNSPLKIVKKEDCWKLTVQDQFIPLVSSIVDSTDLDQSMMQTLAVIAWRYPVVQSEIIKIRGTKAYEHMGMLLEQGFIAKERFGRTYKLKLTKKFFEYFDLPSQEAKQAFLKQVPAQVLQEAENVSKEMEEVERIQEQDEKEKFAKDQLRAAMNEVKKN